jgi:hypothetical protein
METISEPIKFVQSARIMYGYLTISERSKCSGYIPKPAVNSKQTQRALNNKIVVYP